MVQVKRLGMNIFHGKAAWRAAHEDAVFWISETDKHVCSIVERMLAG